MSGKQKKMAMLVPAGTLGVILAALVGFGQLQGRSDAAAATAKATAQVQDDRLDALETVLLQELPKVRERLAAIEENIDWLVRLRE